MNFVRCKIHFRSKSCVLLYWLRYCTALQQRASAKLCGVVQGLELRNFRRGCHLYSAVRPSRWASAHVLVITFCVSRRRRKMYCGHARLCVYLCACLSADVRPHYCTDPDVTWGRGRSCPLVVNYWADLQSVHQLRCYGNVTRTLVYAECACVAD